MDNFFVNIIILPMFKAIFHCFELFHLALFTAIYGYL
jgi:hypothetical protein